MNITFVNHKYAMRLTEAGMPPALADIHVEMTADIMRELQALDSRLQRTDDKIAILKSEIEAKIADNRTEIIKWVVSVGILQSSLITALLIRLT
nr:hypothetical protein [uncultured Duganella sp.]